MIDPFLHDASKRKPEGAKEMSEPTESRYARQIVTIQQELAELQASSRIVTSPEELEELEREIRQLTDRLAAAILGQKVQLSLDGEEGQEAERTLIKNHPQRLKSEGKKIRHPSDRVWR
jgi:hypothetical protein